MAMKKITDLSKQDRPREKLEAKGAEALSDLELMAILLGSGTKEHDVMRVADRILKVLDSSNVKEKVSSRKRCQVLTIDKSF